MDIFRTLQDHIAEREHQAYRLAEDHQVLDKKRHLLEEFRLGLITREEYWSAVQQLEGVRGSSGLSQTTPPVLYSPAPDSSLTMNDLPFMAAPASSLDIGEYRWSPSPPHGFGNSSEFAPPGE